MKGVVRNSIEVKQYISIDDRACKMSANPETGSGQTYGDHLGF